MGKTTLFIKHKALPGKRDEVQRVWDKTSGCSAFASVAVCGQEYDLVKIERDTLRLGARPGDGNMCSVEKCPRGLGQPLTKRNN